MEPDLEAQNHRSTQQANAETPEPSTCVSNSGSHQVYLAASTEPAPIPGSPDSKVRNEWPYDTLPCRDDFVMVDTWRKEWSIEVPTITGESKDQWTANVQMRLENINLEIQGFHSHLLGR